MKKCQSRTNNMTLFLLPHYIHITINKQWKYFYWKLISPLCLPSIKQSLESEMFFSPLKITINYIPHYTLQCLIPCGPQKDEAQVHCLRNHAMPVYSAHRRKLICNLQWKQLNLSLLPLKTTSMQSSFKCFSGETKPIFWGTMQIAF